MASLTPLSKGLIALAVVGAVASAVWNLGLKDWIDGRGDRAAQAAQPPRATPGIQQPFPDSGGNGGLISMPADPPAPQPPMPTPPTIAPAPPSPSGAAPSGLSMAANAEAGRRYMNSGDLSRARAHLEQAVQDGDGPSACLLGEMTLKGQGGIKADHEKAGSLFR
ncbi:MAG: hypothetical protein EOO25_10280, partial [Comamonadaceae bacterium]